MERGLKQGITAFKVNMGGMILDQALPAGSTDQIDPFLLLHHVKRHMPAGERMRDHGVGPHPHRGFSPVTFIIEGEILHQDSRGNKGVIGPGGVQWMNSAMGIIHSERPSQYFLDKGGYTQIIQLWINTPQAFKMNQPEYFPLTDKEIPKWVDGQSTQIKVVAGMYKGVKGSIPVKSEMDVLWAKCKKGATLQFSNPKSHNAVIYIIDGGLKLNDASTHFTKELLSFDNQGDTVSVTATADSLFLYLAGEPINENKVSQGPFVMNSESEILAAMRDYQIGKMGILVEEYEDPRL